MVIGKEDEIDCEIEEVHNQIIDMEWMEGVS